MHRQLARNGGREHLPSSASARRPPGLLCPARAPHRPGRAGALSAAPLLVRQRAVAARATPGDDNSSSSNAAPDQQQQQQQQQSPDSSSTTTTTLARLAAEAVASPVFYLVAGLLAVKLVASTGEQAPAILIFAALPVTALTALSKSPLGAAVQASLESKLPQLEVDAARKRRAAAEARRASPFFGARRPLLPAALGGGRAPWLDGSLAGDYGFDPLGLSSPDRAPLFGGGGGGGGGGGNGDSSSSSSSSSTPPPTMTRATTSARADALAPPSTNPCLARMAEAELLHARWAMLGAVGCLVPEALALLAGVDVGPEPRWWAVGGAKLRGEFDIEWGGIRGFHIAGKQGIGVIALCQLFLMGGPEYARRVGIKSLEPVGVFLPGDENYPGGAPFDPLGLADDGARFARLATSEIRNGRLAMVAMLGYAAQAAVTRKGPVENLLDCFSGGVVVEQIRVI